MNIDRQLEIAHCLFRESNDAVFVFDPHDRRVVDRLASRAAVVVTDLFPTAGVAARTQRLAFVSASLATSAAVAIAGPIGFVGIVVPHLVRLLVGVDHRIVLPASALFGASFLVACDLVARTLLAPVEIPVGVVTAMIGGPFFLWLLVRRG